ncbi:MAG: helix-turn-helix domain-containing protein [Methanoregulaceae archaeon]|nr:helix-turn-helix domain-containing protein [Methanoregulaceae archaeon]
MTEEVIVLEPGDERAQKIGKAIASPTANDILHILAEGPKTASDLTETMNIPMGTLKYHIENLLDAGLIEITETRYSVKGREVKVYALRDQLLIVAPKVTSIRSILLKYASLFVIVIIASMAMLAILPLLQNAPPVAGPLAFQTDDGEGSGVASVLAEKAPADTGRLLPSSAAPVLAFFMGGCLVLLLLILYEAYWWQKSFSH